MDSELQIKIIADGADQVAELLGTSLDNTEDIDFDTLDQLTVNNVNIYYNKNTNGGGLHRQEFFVHALKEFYPNQVFDHCLDWCAGVGFIGLSILANNKCRQLTCIEQYQPAVNICRYSVQNLPEKLKSAVAVCHSNTIKTLPPDRQYDLIVGNPPWSPGHLLTSHDQRLFGDCNWQAHQDFFANVKQRLSLNGVIMLVEGITVSGPGDFNHMIKHNGLEIDRVFVFPGPVVSSWFMTIRHST
jgi:16S rRNA G966 N2-methylase RsmD